MTKLLLLFTKLLLFNTTRTRSGPPSTGASIAMDGGVTDGATGPDCDDTS